MSLKELLKNIARAWKTFLFSEFDPLPLGLFRISSGLLITAIFVALYPHWNRYFGINGVLSLGDPTLYGMTDDVVSLFAVADKYVPLMAFWWLGFLSAVAYTVGWQTRIATIIVYVFQVSMIHRNRFAINGEDLVLRMLLFYACFAPLGDTLSIDAWRRRLKGVEAPARRIWPLRMMQINFLLIYLISVPNKLADDTAWWNGDAIYWSIVSSMWGRFPWPSIFYGGLSIVMTYWTLFVESFFPILVWFKETRLIAVLAIASLHFGIAFMLNNVTFFSFAMLVTYWIFFSADELRSGYRWLQEVPVRWRTLSFQNGFLRTWSQSAVATAPAVLETTKGRKTNFSLTSGFDWFFIVFGALPIYLPFLLLLGEKGLSSHNPIYWYFWANAAISAPHVYSTYCRLGRKIHENRVSWFYGFPCYLLFCVLLAFAAKTGHYLQAMTAVNVWQSIHYVRQGYGVARFFTARTPTSARLAKLSMAGFHLAMPLLVIGRWDTIYTAWGGRSSDVIIPVHFSSLVMAICWTLAAGGAAAGLYSEWRSYRDGTGDYNPVGLISLIVFYLIHGFGFLSVTYFQRGFFAVTIFHAVQYMALVWKLERTHATGPIRRLVDPIPGGRLSFIGFWAILFISTYLLESHLIAKGNYLWPLLSTIALASISAHHYTVDTVMWRREAGA